MPSRVSAREPQAPSEFSRAARLPADCFILDLQDAVPLDAKAAARAAFITPQSMAEVLATLVENGLVERRPDPDNSRVLRTKLTPTGLRTLGRGGKAASQVEARLVAALTTEEQRLMRSALERCLSALTLSEDPGSTSCTSH